MLVTTSQFFQQLPSHFQGIVFNERGWFCAGSWLVCSLSKSWPEHNIPYIQISILELPPNHESMCCCCSRIPKCILSWVDVLIECAPDSMCGRLCSFVASRAMDYIEQYPTLGNPQSVPLFQCPERKNWIIFNIWPVGNGLEMRVLTGRVNWVWKKIWDRFVINLVVFWRASGKNGA